MEIQWDKIHKNVKKELFGDILGIPYKETTPEWNIEYYTMLLKYTNKSVLRKKHQADLNWWLDSKAKKDRVRNMLKERKGKYIR